MLLQRCIQRFQSINQHIPRKSSRLSRTQSTDIHIAHGRLQQVYNKNLNLKLQFKGVGKSTVCSCRKMGNSHPLLKCVRLAWYGSVTPVRPVWGHRGVAGMLITDARLAQRYRLPQGAA